jgi:4-hydroxy-3-polyprenylbenzoate decarboxylase
LWGGKLGIDATRPISGEPGHAESSPDTEPSPGEEDLFDALVDKFPGLRICRIPFSDTRLTLALLVLDKTRPEEGADLARAAIEVAGIDVGVVVEGSGHEPQSTLAWRALASIDPARDTLVVGRKLAVDATTKGPAEGHERPWPAEVSHLPETRQTAEAAARRLGLLQ